MLGLCIFSGPVLLCGIHSDQTGLKIVPQRLYALLGSLADFLIENPQDPVLSEATNLQSLSECSDTGATDCGLLSELASAPSDTAKN